MNPRIMTSMNNAFSEGQSIARPPMFNGSDYAYWKARMKIYLVSVDYDVWDIIDTGYTPLTEIVNGIVTPKRKSRWDANEKKLYSIDSKAMNALICALDKTEYNRISIVIQPRKFGILWKSHTKELLRLKNPVLPCSVMNMKTSTCRRTRASRTCMVASPY